MDTEQAFLRVHARLSGMLARVLTPGFRETLEVVCLFNAVVLLIVLIVMHTNFVGQPACAGEISRPELAEAQIVEIKVTGAWSQLAEDWLTGIRERAAALRAKELRWKEKQRVQKDDGQRVDVSRGGTAATTPATGGKEAGGGVVVKAQQQAEETVIGEPSAGKDAHPKLPRLGNAGSSRWGAKLWGHLRGGALDVTGIRAGSTRGGFGAGPGVGPGPGRGPLGTALAHYLARWTSKGITWLDHAERFLRALCGLPYPPSSTHRPGDGESQRTREGRPGTAHRNRETQDKVDDYLWSASLGEPLYIYSVEQGFLMLSDSAKHRHNIRTANISISAQNPCLGNSYQRMLIDHFIGYDTILINSYIHARGRGYLYNLQTKELYNLNYAHEASGAADEFQEYVTFKCGVLITSLFVFFTTTMSVSFTLRETQSRMLKFTVQLQHHARHRLPTFRLIFCHVIESLVFVPIMIGILFFLFEFFDDQLLAFMVLTLVWLCELFTMISVRTRLSMQYFPRFFFLYFMVFHIYFFTYSYGFSYLAFFATAAFMQHSVLYFWNRHEIPALESMRRRVQHAQQQLHRGQQQQQQQQQPQPQPQPQQQLQQEQEQQRQAPQETGTTSSEAVQQDIDQRHQQPADNPVSASERHFDGRSQDQRSVPHRQVHESAEPRDAEVEHMASMLPGMGGGATMSDDAARGHTSGNDLDRVSASQSLRNQSLAGEGGSFYVQEQSTAPERASGSLGTAGESQRSNLSAQDGLGETSRSSQLPWLMTHSSGSVVSVFPILRSENITGEIRVPPNSHLMSELQSQRRIWQQEFAGEGFGLRHRQWRGAGGSTDEDERHRHERSGSHDHVLGNPIR